MLERLYAQYEWLMKEALFSDAERDAFRRVSSDMDESTASLALNSLCEWLYRYYGKKVIMLLDEYDTPMQEAYVHGFWDELTAYIYAPCLIIPSRRTRIWNGQ